MMDPLSLPRFTREKIIVTFLSAKSRRYEGGGLWLGGEGIVLVGGWGVGVGAYGKKEIEDETG